VSAPSPNIEGLRRLETFLSDRRSLPKERFVERHPYPVLFIPLTNTSDDDGAFSTQVIDLGVETNARFAAANNVAVVPVMKRMADAFQSFIWVGREARCDVPLPFESISKLQAQFVKKPNGELDLLDAGSTNGTFLEDVRLERNKPAPIKDGQRIKFGRVEARLMMPGTFFDELSKYL
jgi:hypothetical protein